MRRLLWEQRELKAPQEQSDEEIEAVPHGKRPHKAKINFVRILLLDFLL